MGSNGDGDGSIQGDEAFVASGEILASEVDDELVILDNETEMYYGLNEVGRHIWNQLDDPRTFDDLVGSVSTEFDVSRSECRSDVESFLEDLIDSGLIDEV